jgi:type I restriction enzyme S subunit
MGDLCDQVSGGGTPSSLIPEYWDGDIPWLTPTEISGVDFLFIADTKRKITKRGYESSSAKLLPAFSILMSSRANIGDVVVNTVPMSTNQGFINIIPNPKKVDRDFLAYWLRSKRGYLNQIANGSTFLELSKSVFKEISLEIPDLPIQKKIAEILGAYDAKIENNNVIIKNLEATAQVIFNEWFVKFRFPGHEKVKTVDSELGLIPEGWEVKKISDIAILNKGVSYSSPEISDKPMGLPLINLKCFTRGGGFKLEGMKYYRGEFRKKHEVMPGQIVIALTDLTPTREVVGRPARVPIVEGFSKILISLDVCSLETKEETKEFYEFLYYLLKRREFGELMGLSASGTTVAHLSAANIENYEFMLPPKSLIQKFHKFIKETFALQGYASNENQKLKTSRDQLLKQLI